MENYSYSSSAASSPRSRDLDSTTEDPPNNNFKVKFLCSYGGQIHPRPQSNLHLTYLGGDTKIVSVDRFITYSTFLSKLSALSRARGDVLIKYQLPGEDLDNLISVTNDEDLHHLMAEHDRLPKPARLRLFLFSAPEQQWYADALNSVPEIPNNPDFLFGLEAAPVKEDRHAIAEPVIMQGSANVRGYTGDYYVQQQQVVQQQYWQERQVVTGGLQEQQPVYLIQTSSGVYQSAGLRPLTGQVPAQGYYGMQPVYNPVPHPQIHQGVFRGQAVESGFTAYDVASRQQGMVRGQAMEPGYTAYDVAGRQVYYTTGVPGQGVVPQYQAVAVAATTVQDGGNVVSKAL